jgi:hypothetical protein
VQITSTLPARVAGSGNVLWQPASHSVILICKVVATPPGAINVISSPRSRKDPTSQTQGVALSADIATPGAVSVVPRNAEEIWPHRQKALLGIINKQLKVQPAINGHDILCLNSHLNVLKDHPKFAYKPHSLASPQYSNEYADWIVGQYTNDPKFFQHLREEFKKQRAGKTRKSKKIKSA